jgi:hypothetical protein
VQLKPQLRHLDRMPIDRAVRDAGHHVHERPDYGRSFPGPWGVAAINPNAKYCEATERAAILPKQWPYSVIARSHHAPCWLAVTL